MHPSPQQHLAKRIFWGTILIVAGGLLLANNLGILPFLLPAYVFSWKMLLVIIGFSLVIQGKFGGLIPMALGIYFIAPEAFGVSIPHIQKLWPAFLIMAGIVVLFKRKSWHKKKDFLKEFESKYVKNHHTQTELKEDIVEATAIFGGDSKKVSSYDFKGGKCTAIFGGLEIDLTNCYLSNERGTIEVTAVFGGVTLRVPKEWNVRSQIVPIMGAVEDNIYHMKETYVDPAAELTLKGSVVMGGVEIIRI
jgi:predicted membrane protein